MSKDEMEEKTTSPYWGSTTKLLIGFTLLAVMGALVIRFQELIGPLVFCFILTFILHPLASWLVDRTGLSWRLTVNLIFLVLILFIAFTATATSVVVINQLQSLLRLIQQFVTDLPTLISDLSTSNQIYVIPIINYHFNLSELISKSNIDLLALSQQVLGVIQPVLGQAGGLLGSLAGSAISSIGWGLFILVVTYFILADAGQVPDLLRNFDFPGHMDDLRQLTRRIGNTWTIFLHGQLVLVVMIVVAYFLLMSILGVHYAIGLALLAGLAKFIPYVGPLVAGVTTAIVAFFQDSNYLGIQPLTYAIIAVAAAVILDQVFDNLVTPRMLGNSLGVHPAAVLVTALIAANLIGLIGLLIAAPILSSVQLILRYLFRKMVDLDPWPDSELESAEIQWPFMPQIKKFWEKLKIRFQKRNRE
jgi:predicted PurR-regulated permease PerM